jgi:hypothetical protein
VTLVDTLRASRDDRLRLAGMVEQRLTKLGDEHRLRLLDACFEHVDITSMAGPPRTLRGDVRDVCTLAALAEALPV